MKIGELDQHCGECGVISYCGNPFGYCLCYDSRFCEVEEEIYSHMADKATDIKPLGVCMGCIKVCDCVPENDGRCDYDDEARDYYCEQVADYVQKGLELMTRRREVICITAKNAV